MNVGAEAHVVGQVVARVVRVFVDHDVVGVPEPAIAICQVKGRNVPVPAVEPEPAGAAAAEVPNVPASKSAGKAAMGKGLIDVIVCVAAASVMADPFVSIHVGNIGMAVLVRKVAIRLCGTDVVAWLGAALGRRLVGSGARGTGRGCIVTALGKRRHCEN